LLIERRLENRELPNAMGSPEMENHAKDCHVRGGSKALLSKSTQTAWILILILPLLMR
jgi:hypothetical protein